MPMYPSPSGPHAGAGRLARAPPCRAGERRHPIDRARQRVQRRGAGERLFPARIRRSPPTAASSPSRPRPPTSWRATRTARGRRLRARPPERARRSASACPVPGEQANDGSGGSPPSISADGRFVAFDVPRLQPRGGRHERHVRRLRARPQERHDGARERVERRGAGERLTPTTRRSPPTAASSPSGPRPPTSWRATRTARATSSCATARTGTTERVSVSSAGKQGNGWSACSVDLRRRPLRRLRVRCHQPRGGRHQRHARRLRARPPDGHDESA